jgi:predicted HTH transcriptional regulator
MENIIEKINHGEGENLEFKFEINSGRKIATTISAFSNTTGGSILIGVKDNGSIAGIRLEEELYVLEAAANLYSKPEVKMTLKRWEIKGKVILEAIIPIAEKKPVFAEMEPSLNRAYLRYGSSNLMANLVHLYLWNNLESTTKPKVFTDKQLTIISLFKSSNWLSLNKISKLSKLPRNLVAQTLSDLIRWNILESLPEQGGGFVYIQKEK